jgi:hypothetical protein
MPRDELESLRKPVLDSFARIAAQLPGASVWDPFPVLCPAATCRIEDNGHPLYFDADHISGYANRKLLPGFMAHLSATPSVASGNARQE